MPDLHYEPSLRARPVVVERIDEDTIRIVVPMRGPYAPVPKWVTELDLLSLVVVPVWWVVSLVVRLCARLPNPPRAVFEVTPERFKMTLCDAMTGETTAHDWPRSAVNEARRNRYDRGFWLDVTGHVKETFLTDLPGHTLELLETALGDAMVPVRTTQSYSDGTVDP
jgi:hypothetical protein